jgi:hypothetical protein
VVGALLATVLPLLSVPAPASAAPVAATRRAEEAHCTVGFGVTCRSRPVRTYGAHAVDYLIVANLGCVYHIRDVGNGVVVRERQMAFAQTHGTVVGLFSAYRIELDGCLPGGTASIIGY